MNTLKIQVENIKCGGCASTITKKMAVETGVSNVEIDIENGVVMLSGEDLLRADLTDRLASLGYPEAGSVAGLAAVKAKAKSVVSCATGRLDKG